MNFGSDPYSMDFDSLRWQIRMSFAVVQPNAFSVVSASIPMTYTPGPGMPFPELAEGAVAWRS